MKPLYVVLIALASAIAGGVVGSIIGGAAGSVAGGVGGASLGFKAGICTATDVAKSQNLLSSTQVDQLANLAYAEANKTLSSNGLPELTNRGCDEIRNEMNQLAK
jgi:outer membrane lipoprotein SlyB